MLVWQRLAILWCVAVSIAIGYANVIYMAGFGAGLVLDLGALSIPQSWFFGFLAVIVDIGMVLGLFAMARWDRERDQVKWFAACALFLLFSAVATHSLYRSLQTTIGSKQTQSERSQDTYDTSKRERDAAAAELVRLRAQQTDRPADISTLRIELAAVPVAEKSRAAALSRQIEALEADRRP